MMRLNQTRALLLALAISGCATQPVLRPVTDPSTRLTGIGYSVLPPQGEAWYIQHHSEIAVNFGKVPARGKERNHTFIATAMVVQAPDVSTDSAEKWQTEMKRVLAEHFDGGNFRLIAIDVKPYGLSGTYCVQYDVEQEEINNPQAQGIVLDLFAHGFVCLDSSTEFTILAWYSERREKGQESFLDEKLKNEGEGFLKNIIVNPLQAN